MSFNKVNTFRWYKERCYELPGDYDPTDFDAALNKSQEWGEKIPIGVLYRNSKPPTMSQVKGPLASQDVNKDALMKCMEAYT